ncbi:MAG: phosphoribosylaminoimidazolesuccinocarboxamide synthase [Candidatus Fimivivens sp.]
MNYTKGVQLYEGKAKKVFATNDAQVYIVDYKDDATAFNGLKKGTIVGKGVINNKVSNFMMKQLSEKANIPTHFIAQISDRETLVRKVSIVPLEVIVRNVCAGSMAKRYGVAEGTPLARPAMEFSYKDDDLGDPMINDDYAIALNLATEEEIATIRKYAFAVNQFMKDYLLELGIKLIDFKLEFGKTDSGEIILADEISPDTCRFWDVKTNEKLDKDRFRRDLGDVESAYHEILNRLMGE